MNLNIFSHLGQVLDHDADDLTEEELEAEAKAERIKFHRERVRNGPTSFRTITSGQFRRARVRDLKRQGRKAFRRQVRAYFANQREAATLRGLLQTIGAVPARATYTEQQIYVALTELFRRFGDGLDEVSGETLQVVIGRATTRLGELTPKGEA